LTELQTIAAGVTCKRSGQKEQRDEKRRRRSGTVNKNPFLKEKNMQEKKRKKARPVRIKLMGGGNRRADRHAVAGRSRVSKVKEQGEEGKVLGK